MVNWQLTATTIYCDAVDDEVTVIVNKDWSIKCTGAKKYKEPSEEIRKLVKEKAGKLKREISCEGLDCPRVNQYRDKLIAEEDAGGRN
jgi:hypothetical protein